MFKDLVKKNRSYRGYDQSRKITREELTDLVDCARLTPCSVNIQPFKYYLVTEPEQVAQIQAETGWARALPELKLPHPGMEPTAFIVICQDLAIANAVARHQKDVGIVAQTMLLAAAEKDLGGCMIGTYNAKAVSNILALGDDLSPVLVVAFGKPMEEIVLTEVSDSDPVAYYRDENDVHYVPKRRLSDIIIN